jgi:integrase/recombinase XerD
MPTA